MRLLSLLAIAAAALAQSPVLRFGVLSDVQYADKDTAGSREYRKSLEKLRACAEALRSERPAFVIQLGDLVDGGLENLERILPVFDTLPGPRKHVLGNHDFCTGRPALLQRLHMPAAYYAFSMKRWRFLVLDGMDVSLSGDRRLGLEMLTLLKQQNAVNATEWNGAVGTGQQEWLRANLRAAAAANERAIVFCHFPVLPESCRPVHLLWNHGEIRAILEASPAVAAYMNGHDHQGGYAERAGIYYVTFRGMVESEAAAACKVADLYPDRMVLRSAGAPGGQVLPLAKGGRR